MLLPASQLVCMYHAITALACIKPGTRSVEQPPLGVCVLQMRVNSVGFMPCHTCHVSLATTKAKAHSRKPQAVRWPRWGLQKPVLRPLWPSALPNASTTSAEALKCSGGQHYLTCSRPQSNRCESFCKASSRHLHSKVSIVRPDSHRNKTPEPSLPKAHLGGPANDMPMRHSKHHGNGPSGRAPRSMRCGPGSSRVTNLSAPRPSCAWQRCGSATSPCRASLRPRRLPVRELVVLGGAVWCCQLWVLAAGAAWLAMLHTLPNKGSNRLSALHICAEPPPPGPDVGQCREISENVRFVFLENAGNWRKCRIHVFGKC